MSESEKTTVRHKARTPLERLAARALELTKVEGVAAVVIVVSNDDRRTTVASQGMAKGDVVLTLVTELAQYLAVLPAEVEEVTLRAVPEMVARARERNAG